MVHFARLNCYGKSKYLENVIEKHSGGFFKQQEKIIEKFNIKAKKRNLDKQIYEDNLEDIKNYLNEADRYYEESRIIEAIDYYEKVLSKSNSEIKEILGNGVMIRINNRILEYRKMINS